MSDTATAPRMLLAITADQKGALSVTGPLNDKVQCLGLLEMAKVLVVNHVPSPIVVPAPSIPLDADLSRPR